MPIIISWPFGEGFALNYICKARHQHSLWVRERGRAIRVWESEKRYLCTCADYCICCPALWHILHKLKNYWQAQPPKKGSCFLSAFSLSITLSFSLSLSVVWTGPHSIITCDKYLYGNVMTASSLLSPSPIYSPSYHPSAFWLGRRAINVTTSFGPY